MKIALISPYENVGSFGIRTLSSCLKQEGHDVRVFFLRTSFWRPYPEEVLEQFVELLRDTDLVGITLTTNYFDIAVQVTRKLKEVLGIPVLWGGIHPTIRPEECLEHADMVCIGEGEEAVVELAGELEDGRKSYDVAGVWYRVRGKIIRNELRPLIQDLDSIPFQDYDYTGHFILKSGLILPMDANLLCFYSSARYSTLFTRGCPFGCSFCCNNMLNRLWPDQKTVRKRSTDNIIRELVEMKNRLPFMERVLLEDDGFFFSTEEEIRELCGRYSAEVGIPLWVGGATPLTLTREKLAPLVDAGMEHIRMGIQTGNARMKKLFRRNYSNQKVIEATGLINEFRDSISTTYDIILDNPWEGEEDLIETLLLVSKIRAPYELLLFSLTFYPGTELYEKARADGIITDDRKDVYQRYYGSRNCARFYINRLFFLVQAYGARGRRLSPRTMARLTDRTLRRIGLSRLIYIWLRGRVIILRMGYLLNQGLKKILSGNFSALISYLKHRLVQES